MNRELRDALEIIIAMWLTVLLFVTAPIWGMPYFLYMKWRG
jgi:hypothetical protein